MTTRLRVQLPGVDPGKQNALPEHCPNPRKACRSMTFRRYGRVSKAIRDTRVSRVEAQRWECTACGYTFRVYPQGVTRRQQSERLAALSVMLWVLGMSLDSVVAVLVALGCPLGRISIYNNVQAAGKSARGKMRARLKGRTKVRVLGVDCSHAKVRGKDKVVVQSIDAETGRTLEIEVLPGEDERTLVRYIGRIAKLVGAEVVVTDDADAFKTGVDAAGVKHQICQRHVVPNTLRLLGEIGTGLLELGEAGVQAGPGGLSVEQALVDVATMEMLVLARTPSSEAILAGLQRAYQSVPAPPRGRKASPFYRIRLLTLDLAEDWGALTLTERCRGEDGKRYVPATNNASEQRIGWNIKDRYRTMRGYKSTWSLRQVPALTAWLRESEDPQVLGTLLPA